MLVKEEAPVMLVPFVCLHLSGHSGKVAFRSISDGIYQFLQDSKPFGAHSVKFGF